MATYGSDGKSIISNEIPSHRYRWPQQQVDQKSSWMVDYCIKPRENWDKFFFIFCVCKANWASTPYCRNVCFRRYGVHTFIHINDLDLWPLTLETFSAMPTHMMHICGKFHWNPSFHKAKRYRVTRKMQTDGQQTDERKTLYFRAYCWCRRHYNNNVGPTQDNHKFIWSHTGLW